MPKVTWPRNGIFRVIVAAVLSPAIAIGCGGGIGELAVAVVVIKLVAAGAVTVLAVLGTYWVVEQARLDAAKKTLELEGMKDGQRARAIINLSDDQLETIQKTGKLKIQFEDGKEVEVAVQK